MLYILKIRTLKILNFFLNFLNLHIDVSIGKKKINELIDLIKVNDLGHDLIRVGSTNDGGYLIPNILNEIDYCFSPGIGNKFEFEKEIYKNNIELFLADATIEEKSIKIEKFDFVKKNISSYNSTNQITLEKWVSSKLKASNNNLLLQMDIEGSEYEVINATSEDCLKMFKILVIEFHFLEKLSNTLSYNIFLNSVKKILLNFEVTHIHPNNCQGSFNLCGEKFPTALEISFLRKDICKYKKKILKLPHKLDQKNIEKFPEIYLSNKWYT